MGTIDFRSFCTHLKSITILCLLTKFGVIIMTTAHFMNDLILFEIYGHPCLSASVEGEFPTGVTPVKMEIFKIHRGHPGDAKTHRGNPW